jgi:DNA repair protein RadC
MMIVILYNAFCQDDIDFSKCILRRKLKEDGRLLGIQVLDHIIITSEGYYSFADEGFL